MIYTFYKHNNLTRKKGLRQIFGFAPLRFKFALKETHYKKGNTYKMGKKKHIP